MLISSIFAAIFSLVSHSPSELIELNETDIFLVVFFAKNEDNKVRLCGKVWKGLLTSNQTMTLLLYSGTPKMRQYS